MVRFVYIIFAVGILVGFGFYTIYSPKTPDARGLEKFFVGEMAGFRPVEPPMLVSGLVFTDEDGQERKMSSLHEGADGDTNKKIILMNFWATWCAPCLAEMPSLNRLQVALGSENFEVVTIATGKNSAEDIEAFFTEQGITNLPRYSDEMLALAFILEATSLPTTVLIDAKGRVIARLQGEADWDSVEARELIEAMIRQNP